MLQEDIAKKYGGFRLFLKGKFELAITQLNIDLRSENMVEDESLFLELIRANCLLELGNHEEALSHFFRLWTHRAEIQSFDPFKAQFNMALCLQRMNHPRNAADHLEYIVEHCTEEDIEMRGLAYRQLASVWRMLDSEKALEYSKLSL